MNKALKKYALDVRGLYSGYGTQVVIKNATFHIEESDCVLLFGGNGSGKSTLLKAIYRQLPLWHGFNGPEPKVVINGADVTCFRTDKLIGLGAMYISQTEKLFEDLSVYDNLIVANLMLPKNLFHQRLSLLGEQFAFLNSSLAKFPRSLSGGQRKLVAIFMAYIHQPKILMFDEPFAELDQKNCNLVSELFYDLRKQGSTIFFIEHNLEAAMDIAGYALGMVDGSLIPERINIVDEMKRYM